MSLPPNRSCVGCRRVREKRDLLRLSFDRRTIRIDPKGRLPGRGLYLCRDEACLVLAEARHAFSRWIEADDARRLAAEIREVLGAGWPFFLGGITKFLDQTGVSERVAGRPLADAGAALHA